MTELFDRKSQDSLHITPMNSVIFDPDMFALHKIRKHAIHDRFIFLGQIQNDKEFGLFMKRPQSVVEVMRLDWFMME